VQPLSRTYLALTNLPPTPPLYCHINSVSVASTRHFIFGHSKATFFTNKCRQVLVKRREKTRSGKTDNAQTSW
jgi:hypothetical protein